MVVILILNMLYLITPFALCIYRRCMLVYINWNWHGLWMYIVQCRLYNVYCTLYIIQCTLYIIWCTMYTLISVQCTLYIDQCTMYIDQCTMYNVGVGVSVCRRECRSGFSAIVHMYIYIWVFVMVWWLLVYSIQYRCTIYTVHCTFTFALTSNYTNPSNNH